MKNNRKTGRWLVLLTACLMLVFGCAVSAEADTLEQAAVRNTSVPIKWTIDRKNIESCTIYAGLSLDSLQKVATVSGSTTTYEVPAQPGQKLCVRVEYSYQYGVSTLTRSCGTLTNARTIPCAVPNVRQLHWWRLLHMCEVTWDKVDSADGYQVIYRNEKGRRIKSDIINGDYKSRISKLSDVDDGQLYSLKVRAFIHFGDKYYFGKWSERAYLLTSPYVTSSVMGKGAIKLTWEPISGATGYEVYVSDKPKTGYRRVRTIRGRFTGATVQQYNRAPISESKSYYVYVVARRKVNNRLWKSGSVYYWKVGEDRMYQF